MTDFAAIVKAYEAREAEAGGIAKAEARAIAERVAADMGIAYEQVRSVLVAHWSTGGAG